MLKLEQVFVQVIGRNLREFFDFVIPNACKDLRIEPKSQEIWQIGFDLNGIEGLADFFQGKRKQEKLTRSAGQRLGYHSRKLKAGRARRYKLNLREGVYQYFQYQSYVRDMLCLIKNDQFPISDKFCQKPRIGRGKGVFVFLKLTVDVGGFFRKLRQQVLYQSGFPGPSGTIEDQNFPFEKLIFELRNDGSGYLHEFV